MDTPEAPSKVYAEYINTDEEKAEAKQCENCKVWHLEEFMKNLDWGWCCEDCYDAICG